MATKEEVQDEVIKNLIYNAKKTQVISFTREGKKSGRLVKNVSNGKTGRTFSSDPPPPNRSDAVFVLYDGDSTKTIVSIKNLQVYGYVD